MYIFNHYVYNYLLEIDDIKLYTLIPLKLIHIIKYTKIKDFCCINFDIS